MEEKSIAVLAAGREKMGITEEKRRWRGLVGAVMVAGEWRDDFAVPLLVGGG